MRLSLRMAGDNGRKHNPLVAEMGKKPLAASCASLDGFMATTTHRTPGFERSSCTSSCNRSCSLRITHWPGGGWQFAAYRHHWRPLKHHQSGEESKRMYGNIMGVIMVHTRQVYILGIHAIEHGRLPDLDDQARLSECSLQILPLLWHKQHLHLCSQG